MNYISNPLIAHNYSAYRLSPLKSPPTTVVAPSIAVPEIQLHDTGVEQSVQTPTISKGPKPIGPAVIIDLPGFPKIIKTTNSDSNSSGGVIDTDSNQNAKADGTETRQTEGSSESDQASEPFEKRGIDGQVLSKSEIMLIQKLQSRDSEVRAHESAHVVAGAGLTSMPSYSYQVGPDGKRYAVGGSVSIDTSPAGTPEETIARAEKIQRAALAPANPSAQDRLVASKAKQMLMKARAELAEKRKEEIESSTNNESSFITNAKEAVDNLITTASSSTLSPPETSQASRTSVTNTGSNSTILNSESVRLTPKDFPLLASQGNPNKQ